VYPASPSLVTIAMKLAIPGPTARGDHQRLIGQPNPGCRKRIGFLLLQDLPEKMPHRAKISGGPRASKRSASLKNVQPYFDQFEARTASIAVVSCLQRHNQA
jgi:hypothetical protein